MHPKAWLLLLLPLSLRADEPLAARAVPAVVPAEVSAAGRQTAVVTVPRFGRYALAAASAEGVSLTVVDRMAGPGETKGKAGEEDGRADVFLDKGDVRLVVRGEANAKGKAKLSVHEFVERNGATPPRLVEEKPIETTLADFEQRSFWISVESRSQVAFEAAGRNLADLRLWKDGTWLHAAEPESEVTLPQPGRPLRVVRLSTQLEPGLYLLSAYGGPGEPWAEEGPERPLHLRWGIPRAGIAGRTRRVVGPSGIDRLLVGGAATFVGLEVPEARAISLSASTWDEAKPFEEGTESASIGKTTNPPAASLEVESVPDRLHLVTVRGEAGQPYVLTHFEAGHQHTFAGDGDYWIGTIPSSDSRDAVDETGVLVEDGKREPLASAIPEVGPGHPWAGRGNFDGPLTLFFRAAESGKYVVEASGAEARIEIAPALATPSPEVKPHRLRAKATLDLDAGIWSLHARPERKGILTLSIRSAGEAAATAPAPIAPRGGLVFPKVPLRENRSYTLSSGIRPGVVSGLVLRQLPLDLAEPLALAAAPGETVSVPFTAADASFLSAETEDGAALAISVDGAPPAPRPRVTAGRHEARVTLAGDAPRVLSIAARPVAFEKSTPLPALPDGALASVPQLPEIRPGAPAPLDLGRNEASSFRLAVPEPGLYRVETTGLLATEALLRTRTVTEFRKEAENGVGRNALVADYLREGTYQVTVSARGLSAGHLGVVLSTTPLIDGGTITDGLPARLSLGAGEAAVFRLEVEKAGTHRIRALGLKRKFAVRLEDAEGWPLVKPGIDGDFPRTFTKGSYRLVVLPVAVPSRVVASLDRVPPALRFRGHGLHALPLGRKAGARWMEPAKGAARTPDRFAFTLPAPADVEVTLTDGMEGRLLAEGTQAAPIAVPAGRGWKGSLAAGAYALEAVSARPDSRVAYTVSVMPEPLVAGLSREVTAPAEVPISIGSAGLFEIASSGGEDVRARLVSESGDLVAQNDDRSDDWNFAIARPLAPGRYTLRVEPAGSGAATCTVAMRELKRTSAAAEPLPIAREARPGRGVLETPVDVPAGTLLLVSAASEESVGLSVSDEKGNVVAEDTSRSARVFFPVEKARALRVSLFSADGRGLPVRFKVEARPLAAWTERQLAAGGTLPGGAVSVALDRPGVFRVDSSVPVHASGSAGAPAVPAEGLVAAAGRLVLVTGASVRASRLKLDEKESTFEAKDASCDLAPSTGPVLVRARAPIGQPGLLLEKGATTAADRTALAAALEAPRQVAISSTSDVTVARAAFAPPTPEPLDRFSLEGELPPRGARAFALPGGAQRLRIALSAGVVALVTKRGAGVALAGSLESPADETLDTDGDRLTLLSTASGPARFSFDLFRDAPAAAPLAPGAPLEARFPEAGTLRVPLAAATDARTLHVRGASGPATLVAKDGTSARGEDLPVPAEGGTLLLPHGTDLVLAWVDRPGSEASDLFAVSGEAPAARAVAVRPPASVALEGRLASFEVDAKEPMLLSLRAPGPAVTLVTRGSDTAGKSEASLHARDVSLDLYIRPGTSRVLLRAAGGGTLSGRATFTAATATEIQEGLGPEALLGAGKTRVYGFYVPRAGTIGVGVRASSDLVGATLLSANGKRLGDGLVQMPDLAPGDYVLSVHAPGDAAPVRIRPALAGIEPPGTGPPPDVIRSYVAPEAGPAGVSAREVEESDEAAAAPAEGEPEAAPEPAPEPPAEDEGEPR